MLNILLTFDYELFFNECHYDEKSVLIAPTYDIALALRKLNVPATFFVDTPSVIRYRELGLDYFPQMVKEQLNKLLNWGHDVQLHIHPIWFQANYIDNKWVFDQHYYSLDAFNNYKEIIYRSKKELDELVSDNKKFQLCSFRAGGFCLTPEKDVLCELVKHGIKIDSSVCCGLKMNAIGQVYDWSKIKQKYDWKFRHVHGVVDECEFGDMIEIPIGTYRKIPKKWMLTHCVPKLNYPPYKGKPSPVIPQKSEEGVKRVINRIKASLYTPILFTLDTLHSNSLIEMTKFFEKECKSDRDYFICAIGHPKFFSEPCVENLYNFVATVQKMEHRVRFVTMKDACNILAKRSKE